MIASIPLQLSYSKFMEAQHADGPLNHFRGYECLPRIYRSQALLEQV